MLSGKETDTAYSTALAVWTGHKRHKNVQNLIMAVSNVQPRDKHMQTKLHKTLHMYKDGKLEFNSKCCCVEKHNNESFPIINIFRSIQYLLQMPFPPLKHKSKTFFLFVYAPLKVHDITIQPLHL